MTYKTWFFDEAFEQFNYIIETIKKYDFKKRFVSHEKVNSEGKIKPHYHILVELNNEDVKPWNNMLKHFKEHYKLRERNAQWKKENNVKRGGYSCFGVPNKSSGGDVYTPEKYARYIAKDGDIWSDIPANELKKILEEGQRIKEEKNFQEKIFEEVTSKPFQVRFVDSQGRKYYNDRVVKLKIIRAYKKFGVICGASKLRNTFDYVVQATHSPEWIAMNDDELLDYLT